MHFFSVFSLMTLAHVLIIIGVSFRAIKPGSSGRARSAFSNPNQFVGESNPRSPDAHDARTAPVHRCVDGKHRRHTQRGFELGVFYQNLSFDQRNV